MEPEPILLDKQTQKHIHQISETMAEKLVDGIPSSPEISKAQLKKKLQAEMQNSITVFFERFVMGVKELVLTLIQLGKSEPGLYSEQIGTHLDQLSAGLASMGENYDETRSPKEMCGITPETMKAFIRAVAYLYENKQYEKSAAVYSFLSFLDPDEPAYWLGFGNSEYFCQRYDSALRAYEAAAIMDPTDPHCHFYSAHCYHELDQLDKAIECCDKALAVIKKNPDLKEWQEQAERLKLYFNEIARKQ